MAMSYHGPGPRSGRFRTWQHHGRRRILVGIRAAHDIMACSEVLMRILLSGIWLRVALVAASLLLFLVAAKNHGRHIRLERQLAGHWEVSFVRANPPWVEALWQRDRVVYWSIAIALALFGLVYAVLARRGHWPMPPRNAPGWSWWSAFLLVVVWPLVIAFMTCAVASLARFVTALPDAGAAARGDWIGPALWGSAGWWSFTLALAALVAWLALHRTPAA
jgi:hypothetical protein